MELNEIFEDGKVVKGWIKYIDGFDLLIRFGDRETLEAIYNRCKKYEWDKHQRIEVADEQKFRKELVKFIEDWKFSTSAAARILPIKEDASLNGQLIDCTDSAKMTVINKVTNFENFLFDAISDLERITEAQEDRENLISADSSRQG